MTLSRILIPYLRSHRHSIIRIDLVLAADYIILRSLLLMKKIIMHSSERRKFGKFPLPLDPFDC